MQVRKIGEKNEKSLSIFQKKKKDKKKKAQID